MDMIVVVVVQVLLVVMIGGGELTKPSDCDGKTLDEFLRAVTGATTTQVEAADVVKLREVVALAREAVPVVMTEPRHCVAVPMAEVPGQGSIGTTLAPRPMVCVDWALMLVTSQLLSPTTTTPPNTPSLMMYAD